MKPIHKYNGGRGATLCHECKVIITEGLTDDLYCDKHKIHSKPKYILVRKGDGLTKVGDKVTWIEWGEDRFAKLAHNEPQIGYSCLIGDRGWLTTPIVRLEVKDDIINFTTLNSEYELFIK